MGVWQTFEFVRSTQKHAAVCIPPEILRIIFEKAMEDEPLPVRLALISWQVKEWVEPSIYRNLSFDTERRLNLFLRTWNERMLSESTKDTTFYRTHVRGIFIRTYVDPENLLEVLMELPALQHFACTEVCSTDVEIVLMFLRASSSSTIMDIEGRSQLQSIPTFPISHNKGDIDIRPFGQLRRFSTTAYFIPGLHPLDEFTFNHPFFQNLTHLDFSFSSEVVLWDTLCHLQNLTHISFNDMLPDAHLNSEFWQEWITQLLAACPPNLEIIIFWCIDQYTYPRYQNDYGGPYLLFELPEEFVAAMSGGPIMSFSSIDLSIYNYLSRLIMGGVDPRAIAASVTHDLAMDHPMYDYVLRVPYMKSHENDWDHPGSSLTRDFWTIGEEMVERRKKVTQT